MSHHSGRPGKGSQPTNVAMARSWSAAVSAAASDEFHAAVDFWHPVASGGVAAAETAATARSIRKDDLVSYDPAGPSSIHFHLQPIILRIEHRQFRSVMHSESIL